MASQLSPRAASPAAGPSRAKRHQVVVACERCRTRKTKCDGQRPDCGPCLGRELECVYSAEPDANPMTALKRKNESQGQVIDQYAHFSTLLRAGPDAQAHHILQAYRQGVSIEDILENAEVLGAFATMAESASPPAFSDTASARSSGPQTTARTPADAATLAKLSRPRIPIEPPLQPATSPGAHGLESLPQLPPVDPRLEHASARHWGIFLGPSERQDDLFQGLLQCYFTWVHPSLLLFDADIFLDDFAAGRRTDFCCPDVILAVALLASPCLHQIYPDAVSQSVDHNLFSCALQKWELCRLDEAPSTIILCIALFLHYSWKGQDKDGYPFLAQAQYLSQLMGLYRPHLREKVYNDEGDRTKSAGLKAIAWGQYNLRAFLSLVYDIEPIRFPPPAQDPSLEGRSADRPHPVLDYAPWSPWPPNGSSRPGFAINLSIQRSELAQIVADIMPLHMKHENDPLCGAYLDRAMGMLDRFRTWFDKLDWEMKANDHLDRATPQLLALHNWFNLAILELFRPFVIPPQTIEPTKEALGDAKVDPEVIMSAYHQANYSLRLNIFRINHLYLPTYPMLPLTLMPLIYLCIDAMPELERDEHAQYRFRLCLEIGEHMAEYYIMFRHVIRAVKGIADSHDFPMPDESNTILDRVSAQAAKLGTVDPLHSTLIIAASLRWRDGNEAGMETIIKKTRALSLGSGGAGSPQETTAAPLAQGKGKGRVRD